MIEPFLFVSPHTFGSVWLVILDVLILFTILRTPDKTRATWYIITFFAITLVNNLIMVLSDSIVYWGYFAYLLLDALVVLSGVPLLLFAYHMPHNDHPREARVVMWGASFITLVSLLFVVYQIYYDITHAPFDQVSPVVTNITMPLMIVIVGGVFVRRWLFYRNHPSPPTPSCAKMHRDFAIAVATGFIQAIGTMMIGTMSNFIAFYPVFIGSAVSIAAIAFVFFNYMPQQHSFNIKLVGITLVLLTTLVGFMGFTFLDSVNVDQYKRVLLQTHITYHTIQQQQFGDNINIKMDELPLYVAYITDNNTQYFARSERETNIGAMLIAEDTQQQASGIHQAPRWYHGNNTIDDVFTIADGTTVYRYGVNPFGSFPYYVAFQFHDPGHTYEIGFTIQDILLPIHQLCIKLIIQFIGGSLFILVVLPLSFQYILIKPLNRLLTGMTHVNDGDLTIHIPVQHHDEIGFLTDLFNHLVQTLALSTQAKDELYHALLQANEHLEQRVAERTRELTVVNTQLQQLSQRLSHALPIAHLGNWECNYQTGEVEWSDEIYTIFGREKGVFIPSMEAIFSCLHPDDKAHNTLRIEGVLTTGQPATSEQRIMRPDGSTRYIQVHCEIAQQDQTNVPIDADVDVFSATKLIGTVQDITERKAAEEALRSNEERLQHILNVNPNGILILNEVGIIHYANLQAYSLLQQQQLENYMFGLPPITPEGVTIEVDVVVPPTATPIILELQALQTTWNGSLAYIVSLNNITQRKEVEEAVRYSEARYRLLAENITDVVWTANINGKFTYVSPSVYALRGYTPEEVMEQSFAESLTPASLQIVQAMIAKYTQYPSTNVPLVELEQPCKDGTTVWTEVITKALRDADGNVTGWIGMTRNITERRKAEAQIRKLSRAIEQSSSAVVITDTNGIIEYVNPSFTRVSGYTAEEIYGKTPRILKSGTLPAGVYADLWHTILAGNAWHGELHNRTKDGTLFWESASITPVVDEGGNITHFVAVKEDITKRKRIEQELHCAREQAEAANHAKSTFLANMSHELRTPLNAIIGFSQIIQDDTNVSAEHREYINIIVKSGEHLLSLINDVLDMSKIEAGHITLYHEPFDLRAMLENIEQVYRQQAHEQALVFTLLIAEQVPRYLYGDEQKIRQVIINLLSNALKFTKKGYIALRVSASWHVPPTIETHALDELLAEYNTTPCLLYIEVEDTGIGIEPDAIETLFQPFVQTRIGRKSQEGTGLGLAISRKFVQLMHGDITVQSKVGYGSLFALHAVVDVIEDSYLQPAYNDQTIVGLVYNDQTPRHRILVADDEATNRQLLVALLEPIGFEVRTVHNGKEALMQWKQWQPHLICMDMRMPLMDGYEATRLIKAEAQRAGIAPPVIIAVTASVFDDERAIVLDAGCDDIVCKPFQNSTMFVMLEEHLGVCYRYAETTQDPHDGVQDTLSEATLTSQQLAAMPNELLHQLHRIATLGDIDRLSQFVGSIVHEHGRVAATLRVLARQFRFDHIVDMTDIVLQEREQDIRDS